MFKYLTIISLIALSSIMPFSEKSWIRINQLGYLEKSIKVAVLISKDNLRPEIFVVRDALTENIVFESRKIKSYGTTWSFTSTFRLDFSLMNQPGAYFIECEGIRSPVFRINNDVYNGSADFLLNYMRQQRCGYNPFLKDSCHTNDGFIIYHPELDSSQIDVIGGWHDASDYLQYVTTSANATYQMLFAYLNNPDSFGDSYDSSGNMGPNGIPDIVDEARWGVDWLLKMNPSKDVMFNQIADDRDHLGFRLPTEDTVSYGKGLERPVYFATGQPQGTMKYQNRSDGLASTAGKYASVFALASRIFKKFYPGLSISLKQKAIDAYETGYNNLGVCQTAPCRAPYFYEEQNYSDDMELAAIELYYLTGEAKYLIDAETFAKMEPVTPWMGADTAKHYEWYPFINLGHYWLSAHLAELDNSLFISYLKRGIDSVYQRGNNNPFQIGIPFIWCSNNLIAAMLTQCRLYNQLTGDEQYNEMEAALRDWLLGCNPWGTSMIVGLPRNGDYPSDPHSAFTHLYNYQIDGGLVDGPVYFSIYSRLIGITLYNPDEYSEFQNDYVVYHDDYGDYSTNEPTMDGTASLTFYFSSLQKSGDKYYDNAIMDHGGIIRTDTTKKDIHLIFSGHEFADGAETILQTLKNYNIKSGFFLTGEFLRKYPELIKKIKDEGHYIGPHSDQHLLYNDWNNRDSMLISKTDFMTDLRNNYHALKLLGIEKASSYIFLPPFEWYNDSISVWSKESGVEIINFTPGTTSNADYTIPSMGKQYQSSEEIYRNVLNFEERSSMNGVILLLHIGTHPERTDKFYRKLGDLIIELKARGYNFSRIDFKRRGY